MTINQLHLFIIFIINGIFIGLLFDVFRILRKSFKHQDFVIYIQDILFWTLTGFSLLYSTFIFNDGEFRIFMLIGAIFGFFIYLFTISKWFIKINVNILISIKKTLYRIFKIILVPIKYFILTIRKIFLKPITFLVINFRRKMPKKKDLKKKSSI